MSKIHTVCEYQATMIDPGMTKYETIQKRKPTVRFILEQYTKNVFDLEIIIECTFILCNVPAV